MAGSRQALALDQEAMGEARRPCTRWAPRRLPDDHAALQPALFRIAPGGVRDDAEAEDVLQEAHTRAVEILDGFRAKRAKQDRNIPSVAKFG